MPCYSDYFYDLSCFSSTALPHHLYKKETMPRISLSNPMKLEGIKLSYRLLVDCVFSFMRIMVIPVTLLFHALSLHFIAFSPNLVFSCWMTVLPLAIIVRYMSRPGNIYLVDYACYVPPAHWRTPHSCFIEHCKFIFQDEKSVNFLRKILERSHIGDETCLPDSLHMCPPRQTLSDANAEVQGTMFSTIDALLKKTGLRPQDIDILVVNSGTFSPTPSLTAAIVNKYEMRTNIKSFNLSGMGCSAGLVSISLARDVLRANPNSNALVFSTEVITPNFYQGKEREMLVTNCLFRVGGAAILLSNKSKERKRAKYSLLHIERTHKGADDEAYNCIVHREDSYDLHGAFLSKDLISVAGEALKTNITNLGPSVLPISEQLLFSLNFIGRKFFNLKLKPYIPNFKKAFEHFCIHAGGRTVISELQTSLNLTEDLVEPSRMTLHRFGNTSSSCLWYELSYLEAKGRMKRNDRVWQIALGAGFKCNSAAWKCLRDLEAPSDGPWVSCIDRYPVKIQDLVEL
ncbi:hypothetical protein Droror1_Dr00022679 [Drosera rotundifolia]